MALNLIDFALQGPDVTLRPLELTDAEELAAAAGEDRLHYQYTDVPRDLAEATTYIGRAQHQRAAGERFPFAILWRGALVGTTSYCNYAPWKWPKDSRQARLGYPDVVEIGHTWLAASAQRTGCNRQAKTLLLVHAFDAWRVHRATLRTDERNLRSRASIERLGAKLDGILRAEKPAVDGTIRNSAVYSILLEEWPAVRARLLPRVETSSLRSSVA
jgi:RimJ/RimL family protein N-acetyltransferase